MEVGNHNQDHPLGNSELDNEYTQGESADFDFGEDIADILQLDEVIAEAESTGIDEITSQSCERHGIREISQIDNFSFQVYQQYMHNGSQKGKSLKKKLKNKECSADVDKKNDFAHKVADGEVERRRIPLMSIEETNEIYKALVDNNCEKNDQNVDLQCNICGFYSENVQARIEHLKGARHAAITEVRNAIRLGILEKYTIKTFYCTICSWFLTGISSIFDHISGSRHKDADLVSRYWIPGVLRKSFCYNCKSILKSNKEICNHMSRDHNSIYYYFLQKAKHVVLKMNRERKVHCPLCNWYIRFDDTNNHLNSHEELCYAYNNKKQKCYFLPSVDCKLRHRCLFCRGHHAQLECPQKKYIKGLVT